MMLSSQCLIVVICSVLCLAEKVRYDGYQVLRITPKSDHEINMLRKLESSQMGGKLSFWREPWYVSKPVDIMVSPILREEVITYLGQGGINVDIVIKNVQELIDEEQKSLNQSAFDYNNYNTYEMIQQWITATAEAYVTATEHSLGTSYEGRNIGYLKISTGGSKKAVVIHGAIHAREWITPATVMYLAKYLVEGGADAKNLLNKFDFYVIPVLNVDGYAYTWTDNRFWRKTRKPNEGSDCIGTDPNRNFATGWGGVGSSDEPCSEIYHGSEPFSEPETAAIRDLVSNLGGGNGVAMYIDYHCYSQLWLIPYGYSDTKPANYDTQVAAAEAACTALKGVHGRQYIYGNIYDTIYPASGGSLDYMYAGQGVQFSYSPEGRDKGYYGFVLPARYIQPSGEENWAAFKAICGSKKAVVIHGAIHAREWITPATVMYLAKYLWLIPYGYSDTKPANYDTQVAAAEAACTALKGVHGRQYIYGNTYTSYPASGISLDYMYAVQGVQFSYTPEGRDKGFYGFVLSARYIQPSGEENWAAFKAICNFVHNNI